MSKIYAEIIPENYLPNGYGEFNNVDFVLTFEGATLDLGSLRLLADLEVVTGATGLTLDDPTNYTKDIRYDNMVGSHSFVESIQTEINGEIIESITEYPRMVKMLNTATQSQTDLMNASNVCQLKVPFDNLSNAVLKGEKVKNNDNVVIRRNPDFSCKLKMCLNSVNDSLPYSRSGEVRVTVNLARNFSALYGSDVDSTTKYTLKNLRLSFTSHPDDGTHDEPIPVRTMSNIKQSIQSSFANVSSKVPAVVSAVSCSFNYQSDENTPLNNNLALVKIPLVSQVQWLFNDSSNEYVSYVVRDNVEIVDRYITSFKDMGVNSMSLQNLTDNNAYGIGLNFGGDMIDLRNQKFNTQIQSGLSSATPLIMFMYFHSVSSV